MGKKEYTSRETQRENKKLYSRLNVKSEYGFIDPTPYEAIKNIRENTRRNNNDKTREITNNNTIRK